jgi:hypothetical protein
MKRTKWECVSVKKSVNAISESEMKQRLAEIVEVLFTSKSQLTPIIATNPQNLLVGRPNKRGR